VVRHSRRGFNAVELLLVVAIIALLVAVLLPTMETGRSAFHAMRCAGHLEHIHKAIHTRKSEGKDMRGVAASVWHTKLLPHLSDDKVFICPADESPSPIVDNLYIQVRNPRDGFQANIPLVAGPWVVKLSQTQFAAAQSGRGTSWTAPVYKPDDNRRVYWLCLEDWAVKSERDFKDLQIKITETDGAATMEFKTGGTVLDHTLYSFDGKVLRSKDQIKAGGMFKVKADWNSYALNVSAMALLGGARQVLCLDYEAPFADVDDRCWQEPVPPFFRHAGQANLLFMDGSVKLQEPQLIRPDYPSLAREHWNKE